MGVGGYYWSRQNYYAKNSPFRPHTHNKEVEQKSISTLSFIYTYIRNQQRDEFIPYRKYFIIRCNNSRASRHKVKCHEWGGIIYGSTFSFEAIPKMELWKKEKEKERREVTPEIDISSSSCSQWLLLLASLPSWKRRRRDLLADRSMYA